MRIMFRVLLVMICCAVAIASGAAQSNAADEAAIREVVRRYVDARQRRDPAAIGALFTADADQFTTSGDWRKGRDAVVRGGLASSARNPGARSITVEAVRFIAPGVAIADGGYAISGTRDSESRPMWTTLVLIRGADGWKIAAIRNALPSGRPSP